MKVLARIYIICVLYVIATAVARANDVYAVRDTVYSDWENTGIDLDQIVVTGTRTPKLLSASPVQTQLITSADIRKLDATNVQDILTNQLPGVEFSYSMNMQVNMNMAGFAGQSVLFLVDGERMAGETNDNVDFDRLVSSGIDHIEIVKGAVSALYGSSANGGVINVITRDVSRLPAWQFTVHGRMGSHGEERYGFDYGIHKGIAANMLDVTHNGRDCYRLHNLNNSPVPLRIDYVPGQDVWNVRDRVVVDVSDRLRLTGRLGYYRRQMVRNAVESEHTRYYDYSAGAKADWDVSVRDHLELSYGFDQYDKTRYYVPSSLAVSDLDVREYSNVQNTFRSLWNRQYSVGALSVGADYMYDYLVNMKLADADYSQSSADAFVQWDWDISDRWELVSAMRYDYYQIGHHSQLTPKVSVACHLDRLNLRAGYGMGFRAPTLKELYYDFEAMSGWVITGNPDLKPERSHNATLSADYTYGHYNFTLMTSANRILDKITTGTPRPDGNGTACLPYVNLDKAFVFAGEATAQARWDNGLGARLSYCRSIVDKGDQAPNQFMPARPHSFSYGVDYDFQPAHRYGFSVALTGRWLSAVDNEEYYSPQNPDEGIFTVRYPGYHMHRLQFTFRWSDWMTLTLAADNLLDYRPDNYYYNAPLTTGREFTFGAKVSVDRLMHGRRQ